VWLLDFVLKALYLAGISKQRFVLKAVAFVIADVCSHRQMKGNFAESGCLMDLCKQKNRNLQALEKLLGCRRIARKAMPVLVAEESEGRC